MNKYTVKNLVTGVERNLIPMEETTLRMGEVVKINDVECQVVNIQECEETED